MTRARYPFVSLFVLAAMLSSCDKDKDRPPEPAASETAIAARPAAPPPEAFRQCSICHSVQPGRNRAGPTLFGIVGSKAGDVPGFMFSPALKQSGLIWDRATLEQWLVGPTRLVPGTRMVAMEPDPVRRKDIIDYLETLK